MTRRDRNRARRDAAIRFGARPPGGGPSRPTARGLNGPDPATLLERLTLALLPLRAFLGLTFVYAGVDKLVDPAFLQATGPGSIGSQMGEFVKVSPIAPLVQLVGQTFPLEIGLLIAVAEIAIGVGALSGLLFRLSAAGGLSMSLLFWLTASWATKPYYYGPDLPYAFGWLTLALAGTGGRFSLEAWLARALDRGAEDEPISESRRAVLKAGFIGIAALAVAGLAGTIGAAVLGRPRTDLAIDQPAASPTGATSPARPQSTSASPGDTVDPGPTTTAATTTDLVVAQLTELPTAGALAFMDPISGDPGVLLKLADGTIVAFDAICTHAGCTVEYDQGSGYLLCPCHGAAFDPNHAAQVVAGPTNQPLARIPIHVDKGSGRITVRA